MKSKKRATILVFIVALIYGIYFIFFSMGINRLPKGELISEVESPNREYTVKIYISETSLSASAVRGELNYNNSNKRPKNIYWDYPKKTADIEWVEADTVVINGHRLNVLKEKFDFRRD